MKHKLNYNFRVQE